MYRLIVQCHCTSEALKTEQSLRVTSAEFLRLTESQRGCNLLPPGKAGRGDPCPLPPHGPVRDHATMRHAKTPGLKSESDDLPVHLATSVDSYSNSNSSDYSQLKSKSPRSGIERTRSTNRHLKSGTLPPLRFRATFFPYQKNLNSVPSSSN